MPCFHASRECVEALNRYCDSSLSQGVIHVQALNGIVHNHDNDHLDWLFHWNIFPLRESTSMCLAMAKGSHLRNYSEVHSLSSDQVFVSIPFQSLVDGLLNAFFCFLIVV